MRIRWHHVVDDNEFLGWMEGTDPRQDTHSHIVFQPEPGVWAGYIITENGMSKQCITHDCSSAATAMAESEAEAT
jgi:hypothetical protein